VSGWSEQSSFFLHGEKFNVKFTRKELKSILRRKARCSKRSTEFYGLAQWWIYELQNPDPLSE